VKIKQNANLVCQTMYIILWLHLSKVLSMRNKFRILVHESTGGAFIIADTFQYSHLCCLLYNLQISVQVALSAGTDVMCSREQQYACLYHMLAQCATSFPQPFCCTQQVPIFSINTLWMGDADLRF